MSFCIFVVILQILVAVLHHIVFVLSTFAIILQVSVVILCLCSYVLSFGFIFQSFCLCLWLFNHSLYSWCIFVSFCVSVILTVIILHLLVVLLSSCIVILCLSESLCSCSCGHFAPYLSFMTFKHEIQSHFLQRLRPRILCGLETRVLLANSSWLTWFTVSSFWLEGDLML